MIKGTPKMVAFSFEGQPSSKTHANLGFFIGPFKTKKGAEYAAKVGPKISIQGIHHYEKMAMED